MAFTRKFWNEIIQDVDTSFKQIQQFNIQVLGTCLKLFHKTAKMHIQQQDKTHKISLRCHLGFPILLCSLAVT